MKFEVHDEEGNKAVFEVRETLEETEADEGAPVDGFRDEVTITTSDGDPVSRIAPGTYRTEDGKQWSSDDASAP